MPDLTELVLIGFGRRLTNTIDVRRNKQTKRAESAQKQVGSDVLGIQKKKCNAVENEQSEENHTTETPRYFQTILYLME